jgi:hypothetical protein
VGRQFEMRIELLGAISPGLKKHVTKNLSPVKFVYDQDSGISIRLLGPHLESQVIYKFI